MVQQGLRSGFLFTFPLECAPPKFEGFSMYLAKSSLGFVVNHILMLTSNPKGPIFQKFVDQAVGKPEPVMMPAIEKRIGECLGYLYPSDRLHIIHINNNVVDWCCRSVDGKISIILWSEGLPKEYDESKIRAREIELNEAMKTEGFTIKALINQTKEELEECY